MRPVLIGVLCATSAFPWPHITARGLAEVASLTTISINLLEIKTTVQKGKTATKTVAHVVKKVAKTVVGK